MDSIPLEIRYKIANFLTLKSLKNLAITSSIWYNATYDQIWSTPRLRKIKLQDLESLVNHPIQELHTSDISGCQFGFQDLVEVLKKFKTLKILIIDHFGNVDVDDIQMLSQLNCRLRIYVGRLKIRSIEFKNFISVLKMLNPESIYIDDQYDIKKLSPSDILTMEDINLRSLSTHHLTLGFIYHIKYYLTPWKELLNLITLKKFRLTPGNYLSETRLKMFNIAYVRAGPLIDGSYLETSYREEISVVIEFLADHNVIRWVGLALYTVYYDVELHFE